MNRTFVAIFCSAALTLGCTHVRAWERSKLAHPTMTSETLPGPAEQHVYAVHEGAIGGAAGGESGCGCN